MRKDNDDRIILALLSAPTVREAAAAAGVSERTVYARLKERAFNQKLAEARREMWRGHAVALQAKLGGAIETIAEIILKRQRYRGKRYTDVRGRLVHGAGPGPC